MESTFSAFLSLPNELLINHIFFCDNITMTDLFHLMLSCSQLHNIIIDSKQLWMCKFSQRWPMIHKQIQDRKNVDWRNWVSLRLSMVKEVKDTLTSMSPQCYPLGKLVNPLHAVGKWLEVGFPIPTFAEDELCELVWNEEMSEQLTLTHYAKVVLAKLRVGMQERNLRIFMEEPKSQNTFLEGAKLISKWFYFSNDHEVNLTGFIDVERTLQTMAERVKLLLQARKSRSTQDILKCIDEVLFGEMGLRVYNENDSIKWNHTSASIHNVLETFVGYPAILFVIYTEVASRMGVTCEPVCLDSHFSPEKLFLRCRMEADVYFVDVYGGGFIDPPLVNPTLIDRHAVSFEDLFRHMMYEVILFNESCFYQTDLPDDLRDLRLSVRLTCVLWPLEASKIYYADLCIINEQEVDDAHQLLLSAGVDYDNPVMINCLNTLSSQNAEIGAAKVPRHRLPSIQFAVGLVMICNCRDTEGNVRRDHCVIVSWDENYRAVSRKKWGLWWKPITDGFNLDQPFYHVVFIDSEGTRLQTNLYVPQETLELCPGDCDDQNTHNPDLFVYFKCFDGNRYVPNDEHAAHFPEDDAVALSLIG